MKATHDAAMAGLPWRMAVVAAAYALVGACTVWLSLRFAVPSPIFPAAGIAAGAVITWGARMLPAVFAGRLLLSALTAGTFGPADYNLAFEALLGLAATLQAAVGGLAASRLAGPGRLGWFGPRVFLLLLVAGPLSCWIAPAIGVPTLLHFDRLSQGDLWFVFYKWWMGDSVGAVWAAPMFLPLCRDTRPIWRHRAPVVVGTLALLLLMLSSALAVVTDTDRRRLGQRFDADVDHLVQDLRGRLHRLDDAVSALAAPDPVLRNAEGRALAERFVLRQLPPGSALHWLAAQEPPGGAQGTQLQVQDGALRLTVRHTAAALLEVPLNALLPPADAADPLGWCLYDARPQPPLRLSGDPRCDSVSRRALRSDQPLALAGQPLQLRVLARPAYAARDRAVATWAVDALALCGSVMVVAFLFVATGRTLRVEQLVQERTGALADSEARLRSVVRAAGLGMVDLDAEGRVARVNHEAADLAGRAPGALRGQSFSGLFRPQDRASIVAAIAAALTGQRQLAVAEATIVRPDGGRTDLLLRLEPNGGSGDVVALLHDLTDLRRLQSAEVARSRAEQENRARAEFVSHMSHELRTPLNAILGFTQLLRSRPDEAPSARDEKMAMIEHAGWHLLSMIENILLLSRLENAADPPPVRPLDLNQAVQAAAALIAPEAQGRGLALMARPEPRAPYVMADATGAQQVLLNLLSNAVKYNRPGGQVRVNIAERTGQWGVQVEDDGPGLTPQQVQGLFIPFNRLGQERTGTKGTGIGLAISLRLAEQMQGAITVDSVPGRGSRFTLWLPQVRMPESGPDEALDGARSTAAGQLLAGNLLYVEDDAVNVELMKGVFGRDDGLALRCAASGAQALELLAHWPADVVLLDLHLPDGNGLALLRRLQSGPAPSRPRPRVIVVSADDDERTRADALAAGAFDVMPKPFDIGAMRKAVLKALQAGA